MKNTDLWGPIRTDDTTCLYWSFPQCELWIRRVTDEWFVLTQHAQDYALPVATHHTTDNLPLEAAIPVDPPEVNGWSRFVTLQQDELGLLPALPDRPLVIRPSMSSTLLPGRWAQFFLAIPVWANLVTLKSKEQTIFQEIPLTLLSNTWFGNTTGGELCYALDTPFHRSPDEIQKNPVTAICPLTIKNSSKELLQFQRLCLHVENLELYQEETQLWTNQITVTYKGAELLSQIDIKKTPARESQGKTTRLRTARVPANKGAIRKTFDRFKEITGL
ncbi:DUF432 domain-containing protein [Spirochaeta lutea]|uniref:DUF432 domain-containing protein n=1 Tax=Spirochaeta lutea TaxID=1480694 RepID=A0A098QVV9_9SPIO|nr:DUF432 domain-containing protein [Spirochaeta lutea]KGE71711.1 hypothetical protein DC28_10705 [Spirochaeta lutea]